MLLTNWNVSMTRHHNDGTNEISIFRINENKKFGDEDYIVRHEHDGKFFDSQEEGWDFAKSLGLTT
jgi:hypothetical protein